MSLLQKFISRLKSKPPVVSTPWGPVTESARKQAALNMRDDPGLRMKVMTVLKQQMNLSEEDAMREMKRRYPEAFRGK